MRALRHSLAWLERQPVARKLQLANLLTSGVVIFLAGGLLIGLQIYLSAARLLEQTRTEAAMTAENLSAAMVFNDRRSGADILASLKTIGDISRAVVFDATGGEFARYQAAGAAGPVFGAIARPPAPGSRTADAFDFSPSLLTVSKTVDFQGRHLGVLHIESALASAYRRIAWYVALVTLAMCVSLALAHLVLLRLQRSITAPLLALTATSQQITLQGDFSLRAEVNASADIGLLANGFNAMLERIETRESELELEIIERRRAETKLDRLAHFDTVTGLHNRHFFNDRLATVVARAVQLEQRAVIMFIDLDNFKVVNDTLGHDSGDELLRTIAARLRNCLRFGDTISRIGGDEFAIILENVSDVAVGERLAEKCLAATSEVVNIGEHDVYVSASIGISTCPNDAVDFHALLKFADTAMYYAKNAGKDTYRVFNAGMQGDAQKRFAMNGALRRALERKEFLLHYQPQIDLQTGRICSVEALIRWAHPEVGMISPLDFIPVAEETGLITGIGNWVLQCACEQLAQWHALGMTELRMAVNLSGRQLKENDFVPVVLGIIRDSGINPVTLELELTESMLMDASQGTIDKLDALRAVGLQLAIDDFGTGYSSMSYLKRFPINTLKVDRSFVRELPDNAQDAAIVRAIILMGHSLGMHVVAEGIETAGQAVLLAESGCHTGQGFFYSKPVSASEMTTILAAEPYRYDQPETPACACLTDHGV